MPELWAHGVVEYHSDTSVFTHPEAQKPYTMGVFMEASSCRPDGALTPFSALLSSPENGDVELKVSNF